MNKQIEPVAWISRGGDVSRSKKYFEEMGFVDSMPLYMHPPALADDEPDWRHPKIQNLIAEKSRYHIELMIVEQLLDDPYFEHSASDDEYWTSIHDKLYEVLTQGDRLATFYKSLGARAVLSYGNLKRWISYRNKTKVD